MSTKRKRAVGGTAQNNDFHETGYAISAAMSREKLLLGEFLLRLQTPLKEAQRQALWKLFEIRLRGYVDLRTCEVVR